MLCWRGGRKQCTQEEVPSFPSQVARVGLLRGSMRLLRPFRQAGITRARTDVDWEGGWKKIKHKFPGLWTGRGLENGGNACLGLDREKGPAVYTLAR